MLLYEIFDEFKRAKIDFAIIGGYALALHGIVRATVDIDLILKLDLSQFQKAEASLKKLGLTSRIPVRAEDIVKMRIEYIEKRNLLAWSFVDYRDPSRQVDILITTDVADVQVDRISVAGRKIPVISLKDLMQMKILSDRPQDRVDVQSIREVLRAKQKT
jgi:hypothetical protein